MSLSLELKDSIVNSDEGVFYFFSGPFNNNIINCDTTNQYFVTGSINITNYTTGTFNIINSYQVVGGSGQTIGNQGYQGVAGNNGLQGFQGFVGFQGAVGSAGSNGFQGAQGEVGSAGSNGLQGFQGFVGFQGAVGSAGSNGLQGFQGFQGIVGAQGNQGRQGNQGFQGVSGFQGSVGIAGSNGVQGNQGFQGIIGPTGNLSDVSSITGVFNQYIDTTNQINIISLTGTYGSWVCRISGVSNEIGNGITVDSLGNSYVTGQYSSPSTIYNSDGTAFRTMSGSGHWDAFIASFGSTGMGSWVSIISGISGEMGLGIAVDISGNSYVSGRYASPVTTIYNSDGTAFRTISPSGSDDAFIVKYASTGMGSWVSRIGGINSDQAYGIAVDNLGNSYVTGHYRQPATIYNSDGTAFKTISASGSDDTFIASFGSTGMGSWVSIISGTSLDNGQGIAIDSFGNSYVTGQYNSPATIYNSDGTAFTTMSGSGNNDAYIVKFGSTGMGSWVSRISGINSDVGRGIAVDISGNSYVTGQFTSPSTIYNSDSSAFQTVFGSGSNDTFVLKLGSNGMGSWVSTISGILSDIGYKIAVDISGNSYVTGQCTGPTTIYNSDRTTFQTISGSGSLDAFIVKFNSNGMGSWGSRVSGVGSDIGYGIAVDSFGNSYVTGQYVSPSTIYNSDGTAFRTMSGSGSNEAFIVKYSSSDFYLVDLDNIPSNNGKTIYITHSIYKFGFTLNIQTTSLVTYQTVKVTTSISLAFYNGRWYILSQS